MLLHRIALVRSPPFSGKTSFCQLMQDYIQQHHHDTIVPIFLRFDLFSEGIDFRQYLLNVCGVDPDSLFRGEPKKFVLVDETQVIYSLGNDWFWNNIKRAMGDESSNIFLFFASYGDRPDTKNPFGVTPVTFDHQYHLDVLKYERDEFAEYIKLFSETDAGEKLQLSESKY